MNDIDYGYTKLYNMRFQNQGEYLRYSPDEKFVDECILTSGHTDATRNVHTLTGTLTSSPSREYLIKISTIGKEPSGIYFYPTVVKIGISLDEIDDISTQNFGDEFYSQFMWFDMMSIDDYTFGIYLNDIIGNYMKPGVSNAVHFVYRVYDNLGNEYVHSNPHFLDPEAHSTWTVNVFKVSLSKYREPTNVDLMLDGYNAYIGPSDVETCRTITSQLGQVTFFSEDTTDLGKMEEQVYEASDFRWTRNNSVFVLSQFEMFNVVANLQTYWKDNFDSCTVKMYITDPEGTQHSFYLKPSNTTPGRYNFNFRICDLSDNGMFMIGNTNRTVSIQFGILPKRHGAVEPETVLSSTLQVYLLRTPEETFDPDDLGVFLSKTANY